MKRAGTPVMGVVVVTFNASRVIFDCLESLLAAGDLRLRIVLVDNASPDGTAERLRAWAEGHEPYRPSADLPFAPNARGKPLTLHAPGRPQVERRSVRGHDLTLIEAPGNGGFAAGVNLGLAELALDPAIDRFWVLNPDTLIPPDTPGTLARAAGGFALMGNRVCYLHDPGSIQIDGGGRLRHSGVTDNIHLGRRAALTPPPDPRRFDFVMGGSMVVSRAFYEAAGPMDEGYFLYYEEVDWALRRDTLPLAFCSGAEIFHRAGSAIGSPRLDRAASPLSVYYKHRARMRFIRRHRPDARLHAHLYGLAKMGQMLIRGERAQAVALWKGMREYPAPWQAAAEHDHGDGDQTPAPLRARRGRG